MTLAAGSVVRTLTLHALALAAVMAASGPAAAQSLKELYDAARGYDATYLAARALADSAQYTVEKTRALRRPSVALSAGVNSELDRGEPRSAGGTDTAAANVNGEYWLYNRSNNATVSKSEKLLITSQADLQAAEQDLIVRVAQAYFDVLAAQDSLSTAKANKKAISEQLASAKRNFEVGTATITDTREAQARYDLATAQEIAADNDLLTKRIALDQLVGRSAVAPQALKVPVVLPTLAPANPDDWVKFVDDAPTVRKAQVGYDTAKLNTEIARAAASPTVKLVSSVGGNHVSSARNLASASLGVNFAMPLYSGGGISNGISEGVALEEQARNTYEAARRIVAQSTRQAFFGVQSGTAQVKALEAAESSSKLALEATQLGYRVGVRVNLDVLNAQTQLFTTQRDLAKARYDVILNSLKLRQAAGVLAAGDVEATNALLAK